MVNMSSTINKHELLTLPEHLSFSGVRVNRSLVLYVYFVDRCLSFCTFLFGHCVVCSYLICGFWLSLSYLQTLLTKRTITCRLKKLNTLKGVVWSICSSFSLIYFLSLSRVPWIIRYYEIQSPVISHNTVRLTYD